MYTKIKLTYLQKIAALTKKVLQLGYCVVNGGKNHHQVSIMHVGLDKHFLSVKL